MTLEKCLGLAGETLGSECRKQPGLEMQKEMNAKDQEGRLQGD